MGKRVVVIDDQPGIRLLLSEILTNDGYQVTLLKTGKEALDNIHQDAFDLIIMDYKLPIMDGIQVLEQLGQQNIAIPTILLSGLAEELNTISQRFNMVRSVQAKPFSIYDISTLVNNLIGE